MPKAPVSTQPLVPPFRASSIDFPCRRSSSTTMSWLKIEGWPRPLRITFIAASRKDSGFLAESWMFELGCTRRISSITSSTRYETSFTPSEPSSFTPPPLMLAKSV